MASTAGPAHRGPARRPDHGAARHAFGLLVALVVALSLVAAGCAKTADNGQGQGQTNVSSGPTSTTPGSTDKATTTTSGSPAFTPDPVAWKACQPVGYDCAWVDVPVNYDKPDGTKIKIAIKRKAAEDQANRIGTLFFNPGGPGASGLAALPRLIKDFSATVRKRFDVVSWDPRGVGGSAPLTCDRGALDFYSTDMSEAHPGPEVDDAAKKWAALCKDQSGGLLPYVGTQDTVRDLESLRQAVGDDKLTYAGYSYGTAIGLLYADRYPDKTRAIILDGVVDPGLSVQDTIIQQSTAVDDALERFLAWCKANPGTGATQCPIAPDPEAVIDQVTKQAKDDPLPGKIGVDQIYLSTTFVNFAVTTATYDADLWPQIAAALAAQAQLDSTKLAVLANAYIGAASPSLNAAVNCLDAVTPTGDDYQKLIDETVAAAPHLGVYNANTSRVCEFWPTPPKPLPATFKAHGAPMIMVWGTTGDNATPYANAVKIAGELENARLVTLEASRHAALGANDCVTNFQTDYIVDLKVPPPDTKC